MCVRSNKVTDLVGVDMCVLVLITALFFDRFSIYLVFSFA